MDKIIEGMKFFDDSLSKKGKMTRDDFAASRRALRRSYQDEMDKLATEYAVRNSIYHVGDKVKVNDFCWLNEPCTILEVKGRYNIMMEKGVPVILYVIKMERDKETYEVMEGKIVGYV